MGLFSSKKKTYVSSVAYPMGEDEGAGKTDYLKYTVLNATLQNRPIAESITQGYLRGQGMSLRNAYGYARDHYAHGVPTSGTRFMESPDRSVLEAVLAPKHRGASLDFLTVVVGTGDFEWWAEQYLAKEYGYDRVSGEFDRPPKGVHRQAAVAYDLEPDGLVRILLMNPDAGQVHVVNFRPTDFRLMSDYVHACYQAVQHYISADSTQTRPAEPGETETSSITTHEVVRAGEIQVTTTRVHTTIAGDTATVRTRKEVVVRSRPHYFLYRLGAGTHPSLDAWSQVSSLASPYYPSVPLRVDNVDMTSEDKRHTPLYKTSKKLLDRVGIDLDSVAANLNDNESIKDIDFAFVVFGVQLKTAAQEGKRYLYRYFEYLRSITSVTTTKTSFDRWVENHTQVQQQAMGLRMGIQSTTRVSTGQPPAINKIEIYSTKERASNYDIKLQWDYIDTRIHSGQVFPGAKIGDVDISMSGTRRQFQFSMLDLTLDSSLLYARRQLTEDTYEELEISGLYFENFIYKGKSISISAYDAFHDDEEEGFILPLNQQVLRSLSLREVTDLSYHCTHLVLNCYQVVKKKWYQRGIFKVVLVIAAIVITVMSWGADGGSTLMATLSMTAASAITTSAILVTYLAATIYVLSLMVIAAIFQKVGTNLFGEKIGSIIAAIATIVVGNIGAIGSTASTSVMQLNAATILKGTMAVSQAYSAYAQGSLEEIQKEMLELQDSYKGEMKEIEELTRELMQGNNLDMLDIFGYMEASDQYH